MAMSTHLRIVSFSVYCAVVSVGSAFGAGTAMERTSLKGLKSIQVEINLDDDMAAAGITQDQIQTDVELRLRRSGIRVTELAGATLTLYFNSLRIIPATAPNSKGNGMAISVYMALRQPVTIVRSGFSCFADTWRINGNFILPNSLLEQLRDRVGDLVDRFINEYLAVNPPR